MATKSSTTVVFRTNSTDAQFRAFYQFVDDLLVTTGGWVHTSDTGQVNLSTVIRPAGASSYMGYKMYAMADALQATKPVYMRIDVGWTATIGNPVLKVTIGTGTNGSGTVTGVLFGPTEVTNALNGGTTTFYGSADTNRVQCLLGVSTTSSTGLLFSLERTKDATGADTGDGLILVYTDIATAPTALARFARLLLFAGTSPPAESGVSVVLANQAISAFGADVGIGLPLLFIGSVQQPGLGVVAVNSGDFAAQGNFAMSVYGSAHTFQLSGDPDAQLAVPTGNGTAAARANTFVGIRYE